MPPARSHPHGPRRGIQRRRDQRRQGCKVRGLAVGDKPNLRVRQQLVLGSPSIREKILDANIGHPRRNVRQPRQRSAGGSSSSSSRSSNNAGGPPVRCTGARTGKCTSQARAKHAATQMTVEPLGSAIADVKSTTADDGVHCDRGAPPVHASSTSEGAGDTIANDADTATSSATATSNATFATCRADWHPRREAVEFAALDTHSEGAAVAHVREIAACDTGTGGAAADVVGRLSTRGKAAEVGPDDVARRCLLQLPGRQARRRSIGTTLRVAVRVIHADPGKQRGICP